MKLSFLKNKKIFSIFLLLLLSFGFGSMAYAQNISAGLVEITIGNIASVIVKLGGTVLSATIGAVIDVASFNDFINNDQIKTAWVLVRDFCNMFFVLILLFIAFAVILRMESYSIKRTLPKLLIMAILINFSRTICGILIDVSQLVMLTFVMAFKDGGANLSVLLNIQNFLVAIDNTSEITALDAAVGYIAAALFILVATVAMLAVLFIFIMRVIMLWIYIVLSPLAFLLSAFPAGQRYAAQFWGEFTKYLINGPVLAFFIWLSLITMNNLNIGDMAQTFSDDVIQGFSAANFISFVLAIGFLVGGMMMSSQIGGMGASWGMNTVNNMKTQGIRMTKRAAMAPVKLGAKGVKNVGNWALDNASAGLGIDLNVARGYRRLKAKMDENQRVREQKVERRVISKADKGGRLAMLSHGALAWDNFSQWRNLKGIRRFASAGGFLGVGGIENNRKELKDLNERRKDVLDDKQYNGLVEQRDSLTSKINGENHENIKALESKIAQAKDNKEKEDFEIQLRKAKETDENMRKERDSINQDLQNKKHDNAGATEMDSKIKKLDDKIKHQSIKGADIAAVTIDAEMESIQSKKISNIENADQLGNILEEAIEEGNQGLIAAVTKKMARVGDYNEMLKKFGYGTGTMGMQKFAREQLQGKAGMTEQASLGLIAEIGNIAKNNFHYGGYAAAVMDNGRWREAEKPEADAAQLAEMMKIQPQQFARITNRLGLGEYTSGDHSVENWEMSKAALAYIKLNDQALEKQYRETGQQNAIEHLAREAERMRKNNVDEILIKTIENRASSGGLGTDPNKAINATA